MTEKNAQNAEVRKRRPTVILKRLWGYLKHYKWLLTFAIILNVLSNGLALIGPKLSGAAIDAVKPGVGQVDFDSVF